MAESPVTIVIGRLADGPCPPATAGAAWPNVLHTRVADLVATMGPAPWAKRIIREPSVHELSHDWPEAWTAREKLLQVRAPAGERLPPG